MSARRPKKGEQVIRISIERLKEVLKRETSVLDPADADELARVIVKDATIDDSVIRVENTGRW